MKVGADISSINKEHLQGGGLYNLYNILQQNNGHTKGMLLTRNISM